MPGGGSRGGIADCLRTEICAWVYDGTLPRSGGRGRGRVGPVPYRAAGTGLGWRLSISTVDSQSAAIPAAGRRANEPDKS